MSPGGREMANSGGETEELLVLYLWTNKAKITAAASESVLSRHHLLNIIIISSTPEKQQDLTVSLGGCSKTVLASLY